MQALLSIQLCWIQKVPTISLLSFAGSFLKYRRVLSHGASSVQQSWVTGENRKENIAPTLASYKLWEGTWEEMEPVSAIWTYHTLSTFCSPIVARNRQNLRDEMHSGNLDVYCHLYLFVSPHLKGHILTSIQLATFPRS